MGEEKIKRVRPAAEMGLNTMPMYDAKPYPLRIDPPRMQMPQMPRNYEEEDEEKAATSVSVLC